MTAVEALLVERLDDLINDDAKDAPPANVRTTVDHLLNEAWNALYHNDTEHTDTITARANVDAAVKLLTAYHERLGVLDELLDDEAALAQGWTKVRRGTYRRPEGEAQAAA